MSTATESQPGAVPGACAQGGPDAFGIRSLSREFWKFLAVSVLFDCGFGLYFFLFNLYLVLRFDERSIGLFTGTFMIGSLAGTFPAGLLARRHGLRPLLMVCALTAPILGVFRVFAGGQRVQLLASFVFGLGMCGWAVCTPAALARLTNERNRPLGFSLNFGVGIGTGAMAGVIGGMLPSLLVRRVGMYSTAEGMRWTLVLACMIALVSAWPLLGGNLLADARPLIQPGLQEGGHRGFLFRFLVAFGIWSAVAGAFVPLANVYLVKKLSISLQDVGRIFAATQFLQMVAVSGVPLLVKRLGTVRSIVAVQIVTGGLFALVSWIARSRLAILPFLLMTPCLYMAGPSIYSMVMERMPEADRSTASAAQSMTATLVGAASAGVGGVITTRYGYPALFAILAVSAGIAALAFSSLLQRQRFT